MKENQPWEREREIIHTLHLLVPKDALCACTSWLTFLCGLFIHRRNVAILEGKTVSAGKNGTYNCYRYGIAENHWGVKSICKKHTASHAFTKKNPQSSLSILSPSFRLPVSLNHRNNHILECTVDALPPEAGEATRHPSLSGNFLISVPWPPKDCFISPALNEHLGRSLSFLCPFKTSLPILSSLTHGSRWVFGLL